MQFGLKTADELEALIRPWALHDNMVSVNICREEGWYQQHRSSSRRVVLRVRRFLETLVLHFAMQSGDAYRVRGKAPLMPFEVKHFSYLTDTSRYGFEKKRVRIYITHYIHTTIIQCKLEAIEDLWTVDSAVRRRAVWAINLWKFTLSESWTHGTSDT